MGRIRFALLACLVIALLATGASARAQSPQPQVVGGEGTTIEEYPWQAAVVVVGGGSAFSRQFCGGSLITSRIVLTAAHCVYDTDPDCDSVVACALPGADPGGDGTPRIDPNNVHVVLGRTTLSSTQGVEHDVLDVDFQDDYNPNFNPPNGVPNSDVGYLVLTDTPATTQTPIMVAGPGEEGLWAPDVFVEITGWGSTEFGGSGVNTLRAGSVPMVSDSTCTDDYGLYFDQATMVCAGYADGGVDTCQGDSGGPLESSVVPLSPDVSTYRLVGITSWGEGCAEPDFPGVYTRIGETALRDAIVLKVADLETANGITPPENIVGTGGTSTGGGPKYPPPPPPPEPPQPTVTQPLATAPSDPFAKCRKVVNKTKRKRCNKKVRLALGQ
jgi:trypsin